MRSEIFPAQRPTCYGCRKPLTTCYCAEILPFKSRPRFVILMHPLEVKHRIGTGRLTHQCLANSELIEGVDFKDHTKLNSILNDPKVNAALLFPGPQSALLTQAHPLFSDTREPVVIVLDATWALAQKMLHLSPNLKTLPRVALLPETPSRFFPRRQPKAGCLSTVEAVYEVLKTVNSPAPIENLMRAFAGMLRRHASLGPPQSAGNLRRREWGGAGPLR